MSRSIEQKVKNYKRGVIRSLTPFFKSGVLTAWEIEFIANGATVQAGKDGLFNVQS